MSKAIIRLDKDADLTAGDAFPADVAIKNSPKHAGFTAFEGETDGKAAIRTGTWECEACTLKVSQSTNEACVLIKGKATITDNATGESESFVAGDGFLLRKNTDITWVIEEDLRKFFVTIDG